MPKNADAWIGPLIVVKQLNDVTYMVKISEKDCKVIHYDLLKPFMGRDIPSENVLQTLCVYWANLVGTF